jgi:hypothetical protein
VSRVDATVAVPPALSGGHRTAMRVCLAVIGVVVAGASLVSLGVMAFGLSSIRIVTETQALPATMRSLAIDTGDVPVVVRLVTDADATEVSVDLRLVTSSDDTKLAVAKEDAGNRVTLSDNGSGFLWLKRTGEIKVIMPPDTARDLNVTVNQQARSIAT